MKKYCFEVKFNSLKISPQKLKILSKNVSDVHVGVIGSVADLNITFGENGRCGSILPNLNDITEIEIYINDGHIKDLLYKLSFDGKKNQTSIGIHFSKECSGDINYSVNFSNCKII